MSEERFTRLLFHRHNAYLVLKSDFAQKHLFNKAALNLVKIRKKSKTVL